MLINPSQLFVLSEGGASSVQGGASQGLLGRLLERPVAFPQMDTVDVHPSHLALASVPPAQDVPSSGKPIRARLQLLPLKVCPHPQPTLNLRPPHKLWLSLSACLPSHSLPVPVMGTFPKVLACPEPGAAALLMPQSSIPPSALREPQNSQ